MKKAYFQYYETFEDILAKIKDSVKRDAFRRVIIRYGLYGTVPTGLTEIEDMAWGIVKDLIDQQLHRREVNRANRAAKKTESAVINESEKMQEPEPKPEENKKIKKFVKPTVEEIAAYCKEKKYNVNAQQFFYFYESNGWKIGRNSMKSWQAAVQNWNAREKTAGGTIYQNNADAVADEYSNLF